MHIYRTELNCILCLKLNFEEENEAGKKSIRVENVGTSLKPSGVRIWLLDTLNLWCRTNTSFLPLSLLKGKLRTKIVFTVWVSECESPLVMSNSATQWTIQSKEFFWPEYWSGSSHFISDRWEGTTKTILWKQNEKAVSRNIWIYSPV